VEAADAARLCCDTETARDAGGEGGPDGAAVTFRVGALREASEETVVLLARRPDGRPVTAAELGAARLQALRARSREDAAAFRTFLLDERCRLGVPLPVPTREVLRSLVNSSGTATLVAAARHREVKVVPPRIVLQNGRERILLPDDPGYVSGAGPTRAISRGPPDRGSPKPCPGPGRTT
jgi:hypothetical protein